MVEILSLLISITFAYNLRMISQFLSNFLDPLPKSTGSGQIRLQIFGWGNLLIQIFYSLFNNIRSIHEKTSKSTTKLLDILQMDFISRSRP